MSFWRGGDPGECIVCGAAHCACSDDSGPTMIVQMPARDGVTAKRTTITVPQLRADVVQATLPPGRFTTGTYRRKKRER